MVLLLSKTCHTKGLTITLIYFKDLLFSNALTNKSISIVSACNKSDKLGIVLFSLVCVNRLSLPCFYAFAFWFLALPSLVLFPPYKHCGQGFLFLVSQKLKKYAPILSQSVKSYNKIVFLLYRVGVGYVLPCSYKKGYLLQVK